MADRPTELRVWDLPTRAVHWATAILVAFSWWSAEADHLPWHRISGDLILALLLFRLAWGAYGAQTARFSSFVKGPATVLAYIRGDRPTATGHSPLGALSVVALLAALSAQVTLGLFSVDEDGLEPGPLSKFIDFDAGRSVAKVHHLMFKVLLVLVAVHLAAIAVYELRRKRLVRSMLTGKTPSEDGLQEPRLAPAWAAWATLAAAAAIAWLIAHGLRLWGPV